MSISLFETAQQILEREKNNDEKIMKHACDLATENISRGGGPFGCVITDSDGNIVSTGANRVTIENDPTLHAEMVAIKNACKEKNTFNLSDCRLYTSCEPCPMCLSAIYWARIKTVFYGNTRNDAANIDFDDSFIYDEINKPIEERQINMTNIQGEYAKNSFIAWKEYDKRIDY
jgi:tRNA(Arg) A34 adenosine deaminase TadA